MFKRDPIYSVPADGRRTFLKLHCPCSATFNHHACIFRSFPLQLVRQVPKLCLCCNRFSALLGIWWHFKFRSGYFLWFRWILHGNVPESSEASTPEATAIQSTPGIPDFMDWNQLTELPWFWVPFNSFPLTLILMFAVPTVFAYIFGLCMFKRRVGGVYFSIITQAIAAILTILIIGQQGYTGGVIGITD